MNDKLNERGYTELAELFKVFGDETRLKLMSALLEGGEMCVGALAEAAEMSQSAVSHQLSALKRAKLVKATRSGKQMLYSLDDDHVKAILSCGLDHVNE